MVRDERVCAPGLWPRQLWSKLLLLPVWCPPHVLELHGIRPQIKIDHWSTTFWFYM